MKTPLPKTVKTPIKSVINAHKDQEQATIKSKVPSSFTPKIDIIPVQHLQLWADNPRKNEEASDKLVKVFQRYGMVTPIVCTKATPGFEDGTILKGNTSFKAAIKAGMVSVPVIYKSFPDYETAKDYALMDNKSGEWSAWEEQKLSQLLQASKDLDRKELSSRTGFTEKELELLVNYSNYNLEDLPDVNISGDVEGKGFLIYVGFRPDQKKEYEEFKTQFGLTKNQCSLTFDQLYGRG
jgi:hypothetical protein